MVLWQLNYSHRSFAKGGSCMKISYDKLWKLLIDKKMKKTDLIGKANISSNVLARMGREESISLEGIGKICCFFGCKKDDILEIQITNEDEL